MIPLVKQPRTRPNLAFWAVLAALAVAQLGVHLGDGDTLGVVLAAAQLACCLAVFGSSVRHHRRRLRADAVQAPSPR